jgi:hypothetical protein
MQNLLSSARRPENESASALPERRRGGKLTVRVNQNEEAMLADLQRDLSQHGICADEGEILQALCDALSSRPAIYRGLIAAYLLSP